MIFGGVPSPEDRWTYTGNKEERGYKNVVEEFYRILDTVDLYFNDAEKACQRIYDRWVETGEKSIYNYKRYANKVLAQAFSVAENGQYADPLKEAVEINNKFDDKVEQVGQFLSSIEEFA